MSHNNKFNKLIYHNNKFNKLINFVFNYIFQRLGDPTQYKYNPAYNWCML